MIGFPLGFVLAEHSLPAGAPFVYSPHYFLLTRQIYYTRRSWHDNKERTGQFLGPVENIG